MEFNFKPMFLVNEAVRRNAMELILNLPINEQNPLVIEIKVKTRSMEQNNKFHGMLGDISKQATWQGDKYDIYGWKNLIVSGHTIATKQPYKLVTGIEKEPQKWALREWQALSNIQPLGALRMGLSLMMRGDFK